MISYLDKCSLTNDVIFFKEDLLVLLYLGFDLSKHRNEFGSISGQLIDDEVIIVDILAILRINIPLILHALDLLCCLFVPSSSLYCLYCVLFGLLVLLDLYFREGLVG
jgi:hypothetical protein